MEKQSNLTERAWTHSPLGETRASRALHGGYEALSWLFVLCVGYQVFLAGMAIFVDATHWIRHVSFVHYFELIPVLMVIIALVAKVPKGLGLYLRPTLLLVLVGMQYAFAGSGRGVLAALHPVNALVIFWLAVTVASKARSLRNG